MLEPGSESRPVTGFTNRRPPRAGDAARARAVGAAAGAAAFHLASLLLARTPPGADHAPAPCPRRARGTRATVRT